MRKVCVNHVNTSWKYFQVDNAILPEQSGNPTHSSATKSSMVKSILNNLLLGERQVSNVMLLMLP